MGSIVSEGRIEDELSRQEPGAAFAKQGVEFDDSRRRDRYHALFENTSDAILTIVGDMFVDCNRATVEMLRYRDKASLLQTHPSELSPELQPDGRRSDEKANEMMALAFERGSHRFEWDHMRADGEVFPVEVLLTAVPGGDEQMLHVVWRDISDRKKLEEDLRHAHKMEAVGALAGGVAHDFNNLLVGILGYASLLELDLADNPELQSNACAIREAAEKAATLTGQLLVLSRKQVVETAIIDLRENVDRLHKILGRIMGEDIALVVENAGEPLYIEADPSQIEQVVLNLAMNARDAMAHGGRLAIRTRLVELGSGQRLGAGRYAQLTLTDTGSGMSRHDAQRAFDPFFTTKEVGRGTGLGLATVHSVARQAGGEVRIETTEIGRGTTFEVLFPLTAKSPPKYSVRPAVENLAVGQGKILLVEDEPTVAGLVRRVLVRAGYTVVEARHGREAVNLLADGGAEVNLIVSDVVMPTMGGPQMVEELAARGIHLPVLFMSGYTWERLSTSSFKEGDVELIRKPFAPTALLERVTRILGGSHKRADTGVKP